MDRPTLRRHLDAGRIRLDAALAGFSDEAMLDRIDDEWTRKDVLAHIEAWGRRVVDLLERLRTGDALAEQVETDELNARFHAADRDRSEKGHGEGLHGHVRNSAAAASAASSVAARRCSSP